MDNAGERLTGSQARRKLQPNNFRTLQRVPHADEQ